MTTETIDPSERRRAAERSAQALRSAGVSLAPESDGFGEPELAVGLLRESFLAAARAVTGIAGLRSVSEARAAFEARSDRPPELRGARWEELCRRLDGSVVTDLETLRAAEATLGDVVVWALGEQRRPRQALRFAAAGLAVAALVIFVPRLRATPAWASFAWQASSAVEGYPTTGQLGDRQRFELVFHTAQEDRPWVLIDLLRPRKIQRITLRNRQDCCFDRGLPLTVEVGETKDTLKAVGSRDQIYDDWVLEFSKREARYVRVRAEANTFLHLRGVEVE